MRLLVLLFSLCLTISCQSPLDVSATIKVQNERMERAYKENQPLVLAAIYRDDAHLIGPGGYHITGREAIDNYWTRISNPVDWKLEVLYVTTKVDALTDNQYWEDFEEKPPLWEELDITLPTDEDLIYQLGRSTLQYKRADTVSTSVVNFILVWTEESNGEYKILLDSYH